jgi:hypothetical protein
LFCVIGSVPCSTSKRRGDTPPFYTPIYAVDSIPHCLRSPRPHHARQRTGRDPHFPPASPNAMESTHPCLRPCSTRNRVSFMLIILVTACNGVDLFSRAVQPPDSVSGADEKNLMLSMLSALKLTAECNGVSEWTHCYLGLSGPPHAQGGSMRDAPFPLPLPNET